jgi:hypothetical protein
MTYAAAGVHRGGLGGAAAWSLAARAQQADRVRRIGWVTFATENDPLSQGSVAVFREALGKLGWIEGHNLRIDYRFAGIETNRVNNATGFSTFYPSIGAKWLQLLKEAAPHITRVAIIVQPKPAPEPRVHRGSRQRGRSCKQNQRFPVW